MLYLEGPVVIFWDGYFLAVVGRRAGVQLLRWCCRHGGMQVCVCLSVSSGVDDLDRFIARRLTHPMSQRCAPLTKIAYVLQGETREQGRIRALWICETGDAFSMCVVNDDVP